MKLFDALWLVALVVVSFFVFFRGVRITAVRAMSPCKVVNVAEIISKKCPDNQVMAGAVKLSPATILCGEVVCE